MIERLPLELRRAGYRVAHAGLVVVSLAFRPRTRGVKIVLVHGGDVLLVRHSYGRRGWDLPGGFCRWREPYEAAARRELREELGVAGGGWTSLGEHRARHHGRLDTIGLFRVEVDSREVTVDAVELAEARWFPLAALPAERSDAVARLAASAP